MQCLDFHLPGRPDILIGGRSADDELEVTLENLDEYINAVVQSVLVDTVSLQVCGVPFAARFVCTAVLSLLPCCSGVCLPRWLGVAHDA